MLLEYAIQPIQQFRYTTGKNATDSALIIDAMDLLYEGKLDGFCLVSSDSDFTRLASRHSRGRPDGDRLRRTQDPARVRHRLRSLRSHRHPARRGTPDAAPSPKHASHEEKLQDRQTSWSTWCAGPSKPAKTKRAGPTSAPSAPRSWRNSPTSTPGATATPNSRASSTATDGLRDRTRDQQERPRRHPDQEQAEEEAARARAALGAVPRRRDDQTRRRGRRGRQPSGGAWRAKPARSGPGVKGVTADQRVHFVGTRLAPIPDRHDALGAVRRV